MAKMFKNLTIQMKLKAWLEAQGFVEVETRTTKYIAMRHSGKPMLTYFLGKSGAFRRSLSGITVSYSTTPGKQFEEFCAKQEKNGNE